MPIAFKGNISGEILSQAQDLPMTISSLSLVNKSGGADVVNVYLISGEQQISISPLNKSLATGEIYESVRPVLLLATEQIKVKTSASTDYCFYLNNIEVPDIQPLL